MPPGDSPLPQETPFHFTNVPAEFRERLIEELKTRPEFKQAWEATVQGAGVSLFLRMPESVEFAYEGLRFTAFAWMGQVYVIGEEVSPSDPRRALPETR